MKEVVCQFRRHQKKIQLAFDQAGKMVSYIAAHPQFKLNAKKKAEFEQATSLIQLSCLMFDWFAYIPDFPDRPWLDIPSKVRGEYINIPADAERDTDALLGLRIMTSEASKNYIWPSWQDWRRALHPEANRGWFEIPTGYSKRDLLRQFETYLEIISKEDPNFFTKKSGGRGGALDKLNQLGAYRILCGRSPKRAARWIANNKISIGKNLYLADEEEDFSSYRARKEAEQLIKIIDNYAGDLLKVFPHI